MALDFHNKKVWLYGGGFACFLIIVLLLRSASGGSSAGQTVVTNSGPTDAQLAAQTQLQLASISAAAHASDNNLQLTIAQMGAQADLAKAGIQSELAHYSIEQDSANQARAIQAQQASDALSANLQASVVKWQLEQAASMQANNNAFQLDMASAAAHSQETLATISAQVVNNQLVANRDVTLAGIASQTAQMANFYGSQVELANIDANKDIAIAQINKPAKKKGGLLGGILKTIGAAAPLLL